MQLAVDTMASPTKQRPPPQPAYQATPGSILNADKDFYTSVATADREQLDSFTLPVRSGRAWQVPAGHVVRISTPDGPQVGDLNIWNLENPRERFWAARTRQLHASHVSNFDRLWSCLPYLRPLVTIIADSLSDYGVDQYGGRCHDLLGTRCDPYVNTMLTGDSYDFHCHSNLTRAVMPWGLTEFDVHDVLNVFQVTGLNGDGKYFMEASPAKKGDYIEFFAEQSLLMALSTCPGGDLSVSIHRATWPCSTWLANQRTVCKYSFNGVLTLTLTVRQHLGLGRRRWWGRRREEIYA